MDSPATPLHGPRRGRTDRLRRAAARLVRRTAPPRVRHDRVLEHAICQVLLRDRLRLPQVPADRLLPGIADVVVGVDHVPSTQYETPVGDAILLAKLVAAAGARRVLELGSHSGSTARLLARHLPDGGRIVAVDLDPDHGWAYGDTPEAARIERRVGAIGRDLFARDERFDLVFIDADHQHEAVAHDTALALDLLDPDGWLLWHDYANWGWFDGSCGVPEHLHELAARLPVANVAGSAIAVHRPAWAAGRVPCPWEADPLPRPGVHSA